MAKRSAGYPRIAVVGAGFAGIAVAARLKKAGYTDFKVFEKSGGPGGVWRDNTYPGAEVDTPSHIYSFSFHKWDWSRSHADQDEVQRYLEATVQKLNLERFFYYNTSVFRAVWESASSTYLVETNAATERFDFVISAVGLLNIPKYPNWPGLRDFDGSAIHTSTWPAGLDLKNKRVGIVGTGSTAVQIASKIVNDVSELKVFQREPGWLHPKPIERYSPEKRRKLVRPLRYRYERMRGYLNATGARKDGDIHIVGSQANTDAMKACTEYIQSSFPGKPELAAMVTPTYAYFGKRPIKDSNFYPTLNNDKVRLVPKAIEKVTANAVVDRDNQEHELDVLIMATGFQAQNYLAQLEVLGREGLTIHEYWKDEPFAFLGIAVPTFPNFFMLYGPNTNSPVVAFMLEMQTDFIVKSIKRAERKNRGTVEVREVASEHYDRWLQGKMEGSIWKSSNNYFRTASGRVVTQWPVSPIRYWFLVKTLRQIAMRSVRGKRRVSAE